MLEEFLNKNNVLAVVGVSGNRERFGYKVFKQLLMEGYRVYGINPKYEEIDGIKIYKSLREVPEKIDVVVLIVNPKVGLEVLKEVKELGIDKVWFQPGAEGEEVREFCIKNGIKFIEKMCIIRDGLKVEFRV